MSEVANLLESIIWFFLSSEGFNREVPPAPLTVLFFLFGRVSWSDEQALRPGHLSIYTSSQKIAATDLEIREAPNIWHMAVWIREYITSREKSDSFCQTGVS